MTDSTGTEQAPEPDAALGSDGASPGRVDRAWFDRVWFDRVWFDRALRIVGGVLAVSLGVVFALYGAFFVPLREFGLRMPLSLVMALVGNPLLVWFAVAVTGRRLAGLLPAVPWCLVYLGAAAKTSEGDLLLTGSNWVGLATLVAGPLSFAVAIYALVLRDARAASAGAPGLGGPRLGARGLAAPGPGARGLGARGLSARGLGAPLRDTALRGSAAQGTRGPAQLTKPTATVSTAGSDQPQPQPQPQPKPQARPVRPRRRRPGSAPSRRR